MQYLLVCPSKRKATGRHRNHHVRANKCNGYFCSSYYCRRRFRFRFHHLDHKSSNGIMVVIKLGRHFHGLFLAFHLDLSVPLSLIYIYISMTVPFSTENESKLQWLIFYFVSIFLAPFITTILSTTPSSLLFKCCVVLCVLDVIRSRDDNRC